MFTSEIGLDGANIEAARELLLKSDYSIIAKVLQDIKDKHRFLPYDLVWNAKRQKFDKIPHNPCQVSTADPGKWKPFQEAMERAQLFHFPGVGLLFTNGIDCGDEVFIGLDFDGVDFRNWKPPFSGYTEKSPSGHGIRMFAYVPKAWAEQHRDKGRFDYPDCNHAEYYQGTAPRFLTLTGHVIDDSPIPHLVEADLILLEPLINKAKGKAELILPEDIGEPIELTNAPLTPDERNLLIGQGNIDRSNILFGFYIKLLDRGETEEDVLATALTVPALQQELLDHRRDDPDKAIQFAREEIGRAYGESLASRCDWLARFYPAWKDWRACLEVVAPSKPIPPPSVIVGPDRARCSDLTTAPPPHEFIVEDMVPVSNGELAAPGGSGKTTIEIWEGIHIILGRDVWGHKVRRPGGVLFLTAEDSRADFQYRLWQIMAEMQPPLSPTERQRVLDNFFIEDMTGRLSRLAELDRAGNIVPTPLVDELCQAYRGEGLALFIADPLSHFGPGERFVNDSEAAMCQIAAQLSRELNAHARLTHHVSKEVARNGIVDQYAGRNGAALADNSRLMMQLVAGANKDFPVPIKALPMLNSGHRPLRMHFHKESYAPVPEHPVWLMRKGWCFHEFDGEPVSDSDVRNEELQKIVDFLNANLVKGYKYSPSSLEDNCGTIGVGQKRIRVLVNEALQDCKLLLVDLPPAECRGRFKQYLVSGETDTRTE